MPDSFGVYDDMKVWEYLDFFARCYGIVPAKRRRMIGDLLELVDLADKRDAYVQTLSRGMQQRLCLAHALVHDPQVLLLDEPASGLDPRARVELRELLRELRVLGKTILISSHILPELEELCTSVAIVDHGQVLAQGRVADIERRLRFGAVLRVRVLPEGDDLAAARDRFATDPDVASAVILDDGTIELGFRGDDAATARLLAASVGAGMPIVTFARAASDLEELFLQVTSPDHARDPGVAVMTDAAMVPPAPPSQRFSAFARMATGVAAIGVKELRGRMRGRRAFVILTIYLLLLGGFALMIEKLVEAGFSSGFGGTSAFASAAIGQGIFAALLMLMTLQVVFLAPSSTAGAISLEREKQTLELLIATPISSLAIVVGKLLSRAGLRVPAHRRVDPAHGGRLRVRRHRPGRRPPRVPRAARHRARPRLVRPVLLEPRQADDRRHRDHHLRGAGDHDRDRVHPDLLAGDGHVRQERGPRAGLFGIRSPSALA